MIEQPGWMRPGDKCAVSLVSSSQWVNGHCCAPVVDDAWQLCERHHEERVRLVAKYGERNSA